MIFMNKKGLSLKCYFWPHETIASYFPATESTLWLNVRNAIVDGFDASRASLIKSLSMLEDLFHPSLWIVQIGHASEWCRIIHYYWYDLVLKNCLNYNVFTHHWINYACLYLQFVSSLEWNCMLNTVSLHFKDYKNLVSHCLYIFLKSYMIILLNI